MGRRFFIFTFLSLTALSSLTTCRPTAVTPSALDPQGPGAARIAELAWLLFGLGAITYLFVMGLLFWALWSKRPYPTRSLRPGQKSEGRSHQLIIGGGLIFPAIILTVVFGFTLNSLSSLNRLGENRRLRIEVIGHQWWWEVKYPNQSFTTANEIHIPAGEPVQIDLTTADVIHSFWVPELHGKLDMIPGRTNTLWLQADGPGQYRGLCAEFCGIQHAKMLFVVVAQPRGEFEAWLAGQQEPAAEPAGETLQQGLALFIGKGCGECHSVRGHAAAGTLGPDLTHFSSRLTLAAGVYPNNRDYLARWVLNPHALKDGNLMPATSLSDEELDLLLAYLESLP
jgi:cytochrome c oxidase subunit 2